MGGEGETGKMSSVPRIVYDRTYRLSISVQAVGTKVYP